MENLRHFYDLVTYAVNPDRTCCFVLDEKRLVRKGNKVVAHCLSLNEIFRNVFSGHRAYGYRIRTEEYNSDTCICI
jgi:hypothetical protein